MTLSVIIPVFNEASIIQSTLSRLVNNDAGNQVLEMIVVDGGSTDGTGELAAKFGAKVITSTKGRAAQMNAGAAVAKGEVLYFLHADTRPPINFLALINQAIDNGFDMGCFRLQFDVDHWFLRANSWFTRFNINSFRFGDQSLFVKKQVFNQTTGFNESHIVLEDQEMIKRLRKVGKFTVLPGAVTTSARKYVTNGMYKTQGVYFVIYVLYRCGLSQRQLVSLYKKLITQDKL